jgi:hypothetical protein
MGAIKGGNMLSIKIADEGEIRAAVSQIVWMARRYADNRRDMSPRIFNNAYVALEKILGVVDEAIDEQVPSFPFASEPVFHTDKDIN